jgi:uncharacterized protein
MVYTEERIINGKKYYYRVISIRNKDKVSKKRVYLGKNLLKDNLLLKENEADRKLSVKIKSNILDNIIPKIVQVLKKYNIKKAGIFGSYARGEQKKGSDIDILVEPPKGMGFGFIGVEEELEKELRKKVDLITYKGISPLLKKRILEDELRIL